MMKKTGKIASVLLALVMVFSMSVTAFAANTNSHTITINNEKSGHTYDAYQVFAGDISNDKLTNIVWGSGVNGDALLAELDDLEAYKNCKTAEDVADVVAKLSGEQLDAFAKIVNKHLETVAASVSAKPYQMTVTGDGYYLVKDAEDVTGDDAATKIILKVVGDVTVEPKSSTPSIDKVIVDADTSNGKGTAQDVGSVVNFKLTSTIPSMDGYDTYKYIVNDTMSNGLTPVDANNDGKIDVAVTIGGVEYTDFTVAQDGQSFTITFANLKGQTAGAAVVITYSATINENALATDKEINTVNLQYSNDPNNASSFGQTPDKKVYVYDFDIVIDKYASGSNAKLEGAKFILYKKENGANKYYKYANGVVSWVDSASDATEVTTDKTGAAKFQGLDSGTYYLHETAAPSGYNLLKNDVEVKITATYGDDGQITSSSATSVSNGQYIQTKPIENKSGATLPSTGGIGTTIFYILGSVLLIGAAVLLVVKRRMRD
ncbi:MAG: SpaH/EbpB family LPXTG-anchored major pilin [Eubacteriaceae bacterium]|nr:SpaH/EbpB family LPXTG-anchored major pilin [Eubacteriaceae bacterium]